ncbi:MAG: helix-hairpin-helix domain-containing protein [Planctomycetes bacterium]|nr:helix-hairpin-helix domain-containing protein [Planctomycetota bacterium]
MPNLPVIDLGQIAAAVRLPLARVEAVVGLLDAGNTVPFITRYRKDQTGGLDEEQIRAVQERVIKERLLAERKQTILRSIESQGRLTPELSAAIAKADTTKRLEDLYLPYKPKKQTLATTARQRELEPLALEILNADSACADLDARARDFVNPDKHVGSAADALLGAGHILAEMFSERADLRERLRPIFDRSGRIITSAIEQESKKTSEPAAPAKEAETQEASADESIPAPAVASTTVEPEAEAPTDPEPAPSEPSVAAELASTAVETTSETSAAVAEAPAPTDSAAPAPAMAKPAKGEAGKKKKATDLRKQRKLDRQKERQAWLQRAFRDYFNFSDELGKIPPHRILAINRGERARILRIKIEFDVAGMQQAAEDLLVPAVHPHAEFLRGCVRDALTRLVLPSLEREVRRELTDLAEEHAVEVFIQNLRKLLLQAPVHERRLLAIDPGFKSGCKLAALDEFGNLLDHGLINIIGKEERQAEARQKAVELIDKHQLNTIVIGNGTACRATEQFVAGLLAGELTGRSISYTIVNEAGASVYSTSQVGRAEFPNYDATLRGAISIGRRLQDPLSELVKIDPANIGVGMYQHDMKAKHLKDSLDAVVESAVNFVGVDLNTASASLLRYVSGLNQLTAQRLVEHRTANGPFRNREQLKEVNGIGDGTFVQAAGFLKIAGGDNPLDTTWIHPESYTAATAVLSKVEAAPTDLLDKERAASLAQRTGQLQVDPLAGELSLGALTLRDIIAQLGRPGRDPRESLPPPMFKQGIIKVDDLTPGMELAGTVLNVVDFGAFVDIGLKDSGLVHISQLADRYVKDPHEVVSVGDMVKVWVIEVDKQRRRVSLTMIEPGTRRPPPQRRGRDEQSGEQQAGEQGGGQQRPPQQQRSSAQQGSSGQQRPPRSAQQQPQRSHAAGGRPPQQRHEYAKGRPEKSRAPAQFTSKPQPKEIVPLTEAMKKGKAPLRTFGDLKQFFTQQPTEAEPKPPESEKPAE